MKIKYLPVAGFILITFIASGLASCSSSDTGTLPQFAIGDKWISKWVTEGKEYTITAEVTGEETFNGVDCWVMETAFDPPYMDSVISTVNKYEKATLDIVSSDFVTVNEDEFISITYEISGDPYYPLQVGKECQETEFQSVKSGNSLVTQTQNGTTTRKYVVEKMEKITVPAGTFNCFKILKYDEYGSLIQITWRADDVKLYQVKMTDISDESAVYELVSYSVK